MAIAGCGLGLAGKGHFQVRTVSSMGCMWMHSTGQGLRHSSQPVHSLAMMPCNCFGCTHDGVHRAGLQAQGATDALVVVDHRHALGLFHDAAGLAGVASKQIRQCQHDRLAAGDTFVDALVVFDDCLCVGAATRVAALGALGLG